MNFAQIPILGTASGLEPETIATVARMTVQPPDIFDLDNLIKSIKVGQSLALGANNLSTIFDCLYLRAVHDAQAALLNWAKNAHDSSTVNSPTFTAYRGYKSNGSTSYLNWNFAPVTQSTSAAGAFTAGGYVIEDVTRGNKSLIGCQSGAAGSPANSVTVRMFPRNASDLATFHSTQSTGAAAGTIANTDMRGFYAVSRQSTTRVSRKDTTTASSAGVGVDNFITGQNVFELATNLDGTATFFLDAFTAHSYWGAEASINRPNLRTSVRDYLILKGVTGI